MSSTIGRNKILQRKNDSYVGGYEGKRGEGRGIG